MAANHNDYILFCDDPEDSRSCLPTFEREHPEFQYVKVLDDGNCFFHSIAAYYARTGEQIRGVRNPTDHIELRRYIVQEFMKILETDHDLRSTLSNANYKSRRNLAKSGEWAMNSFDTMVSTVSTILHSNLHIYGVNKVTHPENPPAYAITKAVYRPKHNHGRDLPTISLFLANNHYGLLYPIDGVNRRTEAQKRAEISVLENAEKKAQENANATAKLLARYAKQASRKSKAPKASVQKSRKASNNENAELQAALEASRHNNNNNIAEIQRQINALEMGVNNSVSDSQFAKLKMGVRNNVSVRRKPRVAVKPSASSKNHNSFGNHFGRLSIGNQPRVVNNVSVRRKPRVASKNVDECKGMLKEELITLLISMGVDDISPKMLKKELCDLYKRLTE